VGGIARAFEDPRKRRRREAEELAKAEYRAYLEEEERYVAALRERAARPTGTRSHEKKGPRPKY
jgi:hypothetical protein